MKHTKIIISILLSAVMLFSFTACMNEDSKKLIGTWEAEFDISPYLNAAFDDQMEEHASFFYTEDMFMTLSITYSEDGTYTMAVDSDKFKEECEKLIPFFTEGLKKTHLAISEEFGIPVETLLDEAGKTYEEMAEGMVSSLDPKAMADELKMTGNFKASGGKLFRSSSLDAKTDKSLYESYELVDDNTLKVTSYTGADSDSNPFTYPMEFKKVK